MKSFVLVLLGLVLLMGCDVTCPDRDAMLTAALRNFSLRSTDIYGADETELAMAQQKVDQLRVWADTLPNRCDRKAYLTWVKLYQHEIDERRDVARVQQALPRPPTHCPHEWPCS